MSDTPLVFHQTIQWPEGINAQHFLDEYWQKKPLLIRQAFPDFVTPLPADELAGLSLEPETTGKLITRNDKGAYHLEYGPFDEERFATLTGNDWSLLVTDVEKHIPELAAFLQPFRFIPDWRIDDLMVSYAPDGASVGAHVDEYDVFLLQGSGVRTWRIDARNDVKHPMRSDGDLKILASFTATDTWDLDPGDMLYLPPNTAHHGIAQGEDCTTWSIGFRAPRLPDLVSRMAELISEEMALDRYRDGQLTPLLRGEISPDSIARFKDVWNQATRIDDEKFACLLGRWLTESNATNFEDDTHFKNDSPGSSSAPGSSNHPAKLSLSKDPFSRFAWTRTKDSGDQATLFVDGNSFSCSVALAVSLCAAEPGAELEEHTFTENDDALVTTLIEAGSLVAHTQA